MSELEFRDGKRVVPDWMDSQMAVLPLHKLTYEQAVAAMNRSMVQGHIDRAMDKVIDRHFTEGRRGPG